MARRGARKRPRGRTSRREPRKQNLEGQSTEQAPEATFPVVVGMGASAGGLEAFTRFFQTMPADSGMAFVVIQHLDPDHESLTAELLGRHTKMPVQQVADDTAVERDHVYVIPPNRNLGIGQGVLRLTPPAPRRAIRMPIDFFFRTLAEDRQERAIGIVLSGSGTDGTLGLKEIKTVGGMALVQEPMTAQHDGMPRSAIAADAADRVLAVEKMPEMLLKYARHPYLTVARHAPAGEKGGWVDLTGVLALLRTRLHFDFSGYKPGTLVRRIRRRMGLRHVERLPDYLQLLRSDPGELKALFKDLLIGVTRFFRDPEAWRYLEEEILPSLLREREAGAPLRVWVAGCGTGEEAYSLGMLLIEHSHAAQWSGPIQVFASDIDKEALDIARTGIYPESIAADVPPGRLRRFFVKDGSHYCVSKELRETIIFAEQNLIADPPFSKLDLISCRNLLIYLSADVQKRVISLLHFALTQGGYLFLGSAESIGLAEDLFDTVSKRWRIYRRIGPTRYDMLAAPATAAHGPIPEHAADPLAPPKTNRLITRVQQQLLERYAPAGVVINRRYEIQLFVGRTDRYLTQPAGAPTDDLLTRVREGLQTRLRALVRQGITDHEPQTVTVRMRRDNAWHPVRISVEPLQLSGDTDGLLLVSFGDEEAKPGPASEAVSSAVTERDESLVRQLEAELKASREDLQGTIAGMEASNEELRAANEEVMSVNEELQSTNEELETSKEELQSLNEELNTVNAQLQTKLDELERTNNDLDNLLTSTNIATVFLDSRLRIRRFTTAATRLFTLIPSDVGRPLADIAQTFTDPALLTDAATVLKTLSPRQAEVAAREGRWYMRQVLPYRTQDNRIEGVVITFSDVAAEALQGARSDLETALSKLTANEARLQTTLDTAADAIITIDEAGRVHSFNRTAEKIFGYSAAEVIGKNVSMLMPPPYSKEHDSYLARYRETGVARLIGIGREVEGRRKDGTRVPLDLAASEFMDSTGRKFSGILRDLTERKQAAQWRREHESQLAHMLRANTAGEAAASLAHQLNQPLAALANDIATCQARLGAGAPGVRALLKHATAEAQRAGAILRRFRDMIRKKPPQLERVDLRDIIRDAAELMRPDMARHHVALDLRLPSDPLPVRVDRVEIEQVILNLVQNALDAVQAAGRRRQISVRAIRLQATRDVGELARVSVEDNGPGISPEAADRLFEPFFTTKKGGLGMGLKIARTLVEAHRGRIWVERRPRQQGAAVRFTLPLHAAPEGAKGGDGRVHRIRRRR